MAISPYDDLFLPLPASLSSRYIRIRDIYDVPAVTTPSEAATRSPYCLSAACPLDYSTIRRWWDSSLVANLAFLHLKLNSHLSLSLSLLSFSEQNVTSLIVTFDTYRVLELLRQGLWQRQTREDEDEKLENADCRRSMSSLPRNRYLQHRTLTTRYNILMICVESWYYELLLTRLYTYRRFFNIYFQTLLIRLVTIMCTLMSSNRCRWVFSFLCNAYQEQVLFERLQTNPYEYIIRFHYCCFDFFTHSQQISVIFRCDTFNLPRDTIMLPFLIFPLSLLLSCISNILTSLW